MPSKKQRAREKKKNKPPSIKNISTELTILKNIEKMKIQHNRDVSNGMCKRL